MSCKVCENFISDPIRTPLEELDFSVLTPFIEITVSAGGKKITVGPNSMPPDNTVSILSLEFGAVAAAGNGGQILKIELIDEKGGEFHKFAESLWTCLTSRAEKTKITASWGWIGQNCDGSIKKIPQEPVKVNAVLLQIDVSFSEGKFKYTLNGTGIGPVTEVAKVDETFGSNKNWIPIKQAITELCNNVPPVCNVEFKNLRKPNHPDLKWHDGTTDGPKNYWPAKLGSKIQTIYSWIHDFQTEDGTGFTIIEDCQKENTLIITEQLTPKEKDFQEAKLSLGTFIVNGGECSLVLDFTTNFNWLLSLSREVIGGTIDQNGQALKSEAKEPEKSQGGLSTNTIVNSRAIETRSQEEAGKKTTEANQEALKAIKTMGGNGAISAQLRLIGMPTEEFIFPLFKGKLFCSVIVINPFNLEQSGEENCPNWLQTSLCNKVLSNKNWIINGVNHMIKDGNYTTTLNLTLTAPMAEYPPGTPVGGPGSAGFSGFNCAPSGGQNIAADTNFINQQISNTVGLA